MNTRYFSMATIMGAGVLGGCAGLPDPPRIASIPIPIQCITSSDVPTLPPLASDSDLLAMDDRSLVLALARDRERLLDYSGRLEAAIRACVSIGGTPLSSE